MLNVAYSVDVVRSVLAEDPDKAFAFLETRFEHRTDENKLTVEEFELMNACGDALLVKYPDQPSRAVNAYQLVVRKESLFGKNSQEMERLTALLGTSITQLEFSTRTRNALACVYASRTKCAPITTLGELVLSQESKLRGYKGLGEAGITEIKDMLAGLDSGLALGQDPYYINASSYMKAIKYATVALENARVRALTLLLGKAVNPENIGQTQQLVSAYRSIFCPSAITPGVADLPK